MNWISIPVPFNLILESPSLKAYQSGELRVLVAIENGRWHLSVSCAGRYPTWDEIKSARYSLVPDEIYMVQMLPPKKDFILGTRMMASST